LKEKSASQGGRKKGGGEKVSLAPSLPGTEGERPGVQVKVIVTVSRYSLGSGEKRGVALTTREGEGEKEGGDELTFPEGSRAGLATAQRGRKSAGTTKKRGFPFLCWGELVTQKEKRGSFFLPQVGRRAAAKARSDREGASRIASPERKKRRFSSTRRREAARHMREQNPGRRLPPHRGSGSRHRKGEPPFWPEGKEKRGHLFSYISGGNTGNRPVS